VIPYRGVDIVEGVVGLAVGVELRGRRARVEGLRRALDAHHQRGGRRVVAPPQPVLGQEAVEVGPLGVHDVILVLDADGGGGEGAPCGGRRGQGAARPGRRLQAGPATSGGCRLSYYECEWLDEMVLEGCERGILTRWLENLNL